VSNEQRVGTTHRDHRLRRFLRVLGDAGLAIFSCYVVITTRYNIYWSCLKNWIKRGDNNLEIKCKGYAIEVCNRRPQDSIQVPKGAGYQSLAKVQVFSKQ
jgi:hypothetical protein